MSVEALALLSSILTTLIAVVVALGIALARTRERLARLEAMVDELHRH